MNHIVSHEPAATLRKCYYGALGLGLVLALLLAGCTGKVQADPKLEAPPEAVVEQAPDSNVVKVDHPEQFPVIAATQFNAAPELNVTGVVNADVSRNIPVISLASGRVIEVLARLGDTVTKGQVLMRVQSADISGAYSDYQQAIADEVLARSQYERAKLLYEKGAIAQKDVEVALDADAKAKVTVKPREQHLTISARIRNIPPPLSNQGAGVRRDHRSGSDECRGSASVRSQPVYHFRSLARLGPLRCV